jgi:hypothetical protein
MRYEPPIIVKRVEVEALLGPVKQISDLPPK